MHPIFKSGFAQKLYEQVYFLKDRFNGFNKISGHFKKKNGYSLDLTTPRTHNQRIVHKMIFDRDPLLIITSDKVKVREYVRKKLGKEKAEQVLIPQFHVTKSGKDFPRDIWEKEFFMKANHASGYNRLVKPGDDPQEIKNLAQFWLSQSFGQVNHAWAYKDIPRRVVCEQVIRDEKGEIPMDIKLHCFHGQVKMILFLQDRFGNTSRIYTDENLREIPGSQMLGEKTLDKIPDLANLPELISLSEKLSQDFIFSRIDLYAVGEKIYFGEITHYSGAGTRRFDDFQTDLAFGELWKPENKDLNIFDVLRKLDKDKG